MTKVKNLVSFYEGLNNRNEMENEGSINLWTAVGPCCVVAQESPSGGRISAASAEGVENPPCAAAILNGESSKTSSLPYLASHRESLITIVPDYSNLYPKIGPGLSEEGDRFDLNERGFESVPITLLEETEEASPPDSNNPYSVLSDDVDDVDSCSRRKQLRKKAETLVRWFRQMGITKERDLPSEIICGGLRSAVRQCFPVVLDELQELSFKTIQKVEKNCCGNCEPRFYELLDEWKSSRFAPQDIDSDHLKRFKQAMRWNVDKGWDSHRRPFIPNGNATRHYKRREGGNWNREAFSTECRVELVFSSGKPRIVTLYSSDNTMTLAPLHYSLYHCMKRKGWLLVGDPTDKHIDRLNGRTFVSVDYSSATDNIKTDYVRAAIEVLIERADGLSDHEIECLRVLSDWGLGSGDLVTRGQPMGSIMSFPLLCLINKTVVDMALCDLLDRGSISFREWVDHRCLINGDDLLFREPRPGLAMRERVIHNGSKVGLVVNTEKTMCHDQKAEINSTLFVDGKFQRKQNVSALWMDPDVNDVLGYAAEATVSVRDFVRVARANAYILAKQTDKRLWALPAHLRTACRRDKKIRRAITSGPVALRPFEEGVIRMAERPDGYDLNRDEENEAMLSEIDRVRDEALLRAEVRKPKFKTKSIPDVRSYSSALKKPKSDERELIPLCYVRRHDLKIKEALVSSTVVCDDGLELPPSDLGSLAASLIDYMRSRKRKITVRPKMMDEVSAQFISVVC